MCTRCKSRSKQRKDITDKKSVNISIMISKLMLIRECILNRVNYFCFIYTYIITVIFTVVNRVNNDYLVKGRKMSLLKEIRYFTKNI